MNHSKNGNGKCPVMHGGNTTLDKPVTKWWPKCPQPGHPASARYQDQPFR
jgi:hypothetical protein